MRQLGIAFFLSAFLTPHATNAKDKKNVPVAPLPAVALSADSTDARPLFGCVREGPSRLPVSARRNRRSGSGIVRLLWVERVW
jgi:hypothetical protein